MSLLRSGYYGLTWLAAPVISGLLEWRAAKGKEDKTRLHERKGIATCPRPPKPLIWLNAVSVGEALTALVMSQAILRQYPDFCILLTTTTCTSAQIIGSRLPRNVIHQYNPVDTPHAINRFLNHWKPDLAIWVESDLWPNLVHQTQERGIPTLLLNGRMSLKSFRNWQKGRSLISPLLGRLSLCAVQSEEEGTRFRALGATALSVMGNAKLMMAPLDVNAEKYSSLKSAIGERPIWLAASIHPEEDEIVLQAHEQLKKDYPTLLTILVPRHVERAESLRQAFLGRGILTALRTETSSLENVEVYIGNTLGELGLFYALTPVAMMGATYVPKGGHNPLEAAQLGAFVVHGSHTFNNPQLYELLASLGLSHETTDISLAVAPWLKARKKGYEEPPSFKACREKNLSSLLRLLTPHLNPLRKGKP